MVRRLELHQLLINKTGLQNVYYQPPEGLKLKYPCIIYKRDRLQPMSADNGPYVVNTRYEVTVIDRNADSAIPHIMLEFPCCSNDRRFVVDGLYHDVFTLYY